jgi:hypothetical protein
MLNHYEITLRDPKGWKLACDANTDAYGAQVMRYAERWAHLMEQRIATGKKVIEVADETSHLADHEGISLVMYGCAVAILARVWQHGEELNQWHHLHEDPVNAQ